MSNIKLPHQRIRYETLAATNHCVSCGKALPFDDNHRLCVSCRQRSRLSAKRLYELRKEKGVCIKCGKPPVVEGQLVCAACYARRIANRAKRKEAAKNDGEAKE